MAIFNSYVSHYQRVSPHSESGMNFNPHGPSPKWNTRPAGAVALALSLGCNGAPEGTLSSSLLAMEIAQLSPTGHEMMMMMILHVRGVIHSSRHPIGPIARQSKSHSHGGLSEHPFKYVKSFWPLPISTIMCLESWGLNQTTLITYYQTHRNALSPLSHSQRVYDGIQDSPLLDRKVW